MLNRLALMLLVSVFAPLALARISVPQPKDPYASLGPGEHIDVLEHERGTTYIELVAKNAVTTQSSFDAQIAAVEKAVRQTVGHYAADEHMTSLSLLNSVLFGLAVEYRYHGPLREFKEQWVDSKSEKEARELAVEAAGVIMSAIANLPNERFEINMEFRQQQSLSSPLMVLKSYLSQPGNPEHEPFFANEHMPMLQLQIRRAESKTGLLSRWRALFADEVSTLRKSCSAFSGVKIPAH